MNFRKRKPVWFAFVWLWLWNCAETKLSWRIICQLDKKYCNRSFAPVTLTEEKWKANLPKLSWVSGLFEFLCWGPWRGRRESWPVAMQRCPITWWDLPTLCPRWKHHLGRRCRSLALRYHMRQEVAALWDLSYFTLKWFLRYSSRVPRRGNEREKEDLVLALLYLLIWSRQVWLTFIKPREVLTR